MAARRSRSAPHLDWPLSHDEKRTCVLSLFDKDVSAANEVIRSNEEKLEELQHELKKARSAASAGQGYERSARRKESVPDDAGLHGDAAAEQLRAFIASAAAALKVLENRGNKDDEADVASDDCSPRPARARSEGPVAGILCKDPKRRSRGPSVTGEKKRVSFGNREPEPEISTPDRAPTEQEVEWSPRALHPICTPPDYQKQGPWKPVLREELGPWELEKAMSRETDGRSPHPRVSNRCSDTPEGRQKSSERTGARRTGQSAGTPRRVYPLTTAAAPRTGRVWRPGRT